MIILSTIDPADCGDPAIYTGANLPALITEFLADWTETLEDMGLDYPILTTKRSLEKFLTGTLELNYTILEV